MRIFELELCADELVVAAALGGLMTGGGGAFFIGGGGGSVRLVERTLKQRTRWIGVFSWFYRGQPLHLLYPLGCLRRKVNCEFICMLCTMS